MKPETNIELVTPEGVVLELPLAPRLARLTAFGIDMAFSLLAGAVIIVAGIIIGVSGSDTGGWSVILLGLFLLRHGYFVWFEVRWNGLTPGKRMLKLRVVPADGGVLTLESVLARNIMRDVELLLPAVALLAPETITGPLPFWANLVALAWIGVFSALPLLTAERLRAGDLVGGTVVVQVPTARLLADEASSAIEGIRFTSKHLSVYGERELETLALVLRRADRGEIDREDLGLIAETIARKVGFKGSHASRDPGSFLRSFYRAQRTELEQRLVMGKRKTDKLDT